MNSLIDPGKDDSKVWWESKTLWVSVITAVLPLIPPFAPFIAANPGILTALGAVFAALRVTTDSPVRLRK